MNDAKTAALPEPTQEQLDAFIKRAGFPYGRMNLESSARRMAERAVSEIAALQPQPAAAGVSDVEIERIAIESELVFRSGGKLLTPFLEHIDLTRNVRAFARAILALRPQAAPMTWELLTDERIKSEDFNGMYWLALKNGTVTTGCYQWRQGHNPYGFNTEEQGRVIASDVSHIVPLAEPAHPGITAQGAQGGEG